MPIVGSVNISPIFSIQLKNHQFLLFQGNSLFFMEEEQKKTDKSVLCEVCKQQVAKYTCPACFKKTCSLECVRLHKKQVSIKILELEIG